jgi:hypothetical protein
MMRDHSKACFMGHELPIDRCPSDNDSRVAFTIGYWCRLLGMRPTRLTARTDPLLGDIYRLEVSGQERPYTLQAWPHPQNANQTLITGGPDPLSLG